MSNIIKLSFLLPILITNTFANVRAKIPRPELRRQEQAQAQKIIEAHREANRDFSREFIERGGKHVVKDALEPLSTHELISHVPKASVLQPVPEAVAARFQPELIRRIDQAFVTMNKEHGALFALAKIVDPIWSKLNEVNSQLLKESPRVIELVETLIAKDQKSLNDANFDFFRETLKDLDSAKSKSDPLKQLEEVVAQGKEREIALEYIEAFEYYRGLMVQVVNNFKRVGDGHFKHEEIFMYLFGISGSGSRAPMTKDYQNHLEKHDQLREKLSRLVVEAQTHEVNIPNFLIWAKSVSEFFHNWLKVHIKDTDKEAYQQPLHTVEHITILKLIEPNLEHIPERLLHRWNLENPKEYFLEVIEKDGLHFD